MSKHLLTLHRRHAKGEHHININEIHEETMGTGDHLADTMANIIGSWHFIIIQACILALWFTLNNDYHVNQQAEQHIETILNRLDAQDKLILKTVENTQQIVEQIATRKMQKKSLVG